MTSIILRRIRTPPSASSRFSSIKAVNIATANAQVTAISQTLLKQLPAGVRRPRLIVNYSASTVPIIQLALSGKGLTEQNLADLGLNFVRTRLVTVQGAGIPVPLRRKDTASDVRPRHRCAMQALGLDRPGMWPMRSGESESC